MKTANKLLRFLKNTKVQITLLLFLPSLIVVFFCIFDSLYHIDNYRNLIISKYSNELNSFLKYTDEKIDFTIKNMLFISNTEDISLALNTDSELPVEKYHSLSYQLGDAGELLDIVDNIIIYNKKANIVFTPHGIFEPEEYFDNLSKYGQYPFSYWNNYNTLYNGVNILAPNSITNDTSSLSKTIVPLALTSANNQSHSILIANINLNEIFEEFETHRLTPNSQIYMVDNKSGNAYSDSDFYNSENFKYTLIKHLSNSLYSNADTVLMNGKEYLLIKSTKRSSSWGYSYLVAVPYSDIKSNMAEIFTVSFVSVSFMLILIFLYIFFARKQLYNPWKKMLLSLNSANYENIENIPDYVTNSIISLSSENKTLEKNFESMLSFNQEKYLISILNEGISATDDALNELDFKYEYFMAISIHIITSANFFADENFAQYNIIHKRLQQTIKAFFTQDFITYELPCTKNIMYLLLNLEDQSQYENVIATIENTKRILDNDKDRLLVIFSHGNIYKGCQGLYLTHQESISNMIKMLNLNEIQFAAAGQSIFSSENEAILNNYFNLRMVDKIISYTSELLSSTKNAPINKKQQAYIDISNYLRAKIIKMDIQSAIPYIDFIINMANNNVSDENIHAAIFNILDKIKDHMQINSRKFIIEDVILYIDEHYTENIFLDDLAQIFNISSKHLSKKIKEYLGVPFKEYITTKKIDKAKELLEQTNITINELYSNVGFQDRISFTRAFKQKTGMSPSEFKSNVRNINKD